MAKTIEDHVREFRSLARCKILIRVMYFLDPEDHTKVVTGYTLFTEAPDGTMYKVHSNLTHNINCIFVVLNTTHPIAIVRIDDEEISEFLKRWHAPFSQIDVTDTSGGIARKTVLNLLIDLIYVFQCLHKYFINHPAGNDYHLARLFVERLRGFIEEKLRELNGAIIKLSDLSPTAHFE